MKTKKNKKSGLTEAEIEEILRKRNEKVVTRSGRVSKKSASYTDKMFLEDLLGSDSSSDSDFDPGTGEESSDSDSDSDSDSPRWKKR
jgi:hypothetical protein